MRRFLFAACLMAISGASFPAQIRRAPEQLSAWPYFKEIRPSGGPAGWVNFVIDREVFDKARADQADLRLYDGAGREIPYLLRVRREVEIHDAVAGRLFNRSEAAGSIQVSCDLGEQPQEHNEVEIETGGDNFRRLAEVEGSPDGERWSTLASGAILFRFSAGGRTAEQRAVSYPVSRFRYLRVRVNWDPQVDRAAPEIKNLRVRRSIRMRGEMVPFAGTLAGREPDRVSGRPASVWRVDLGGRIPLQRLLIAVEGGVFSRPYRVDVIDDPAAPAFLASGELARHEDSAPAPLAIDFGECFARRLKLTVTDDRNPPLSVAGVTALSAARQVILEPASADGSPLRLYYGNPKALAPRYDLAARIPAHLAAGPSHLTLGPQQENPIYRPEPKPLSERSPWLAYAVLAVACLALAAILMNLAKKIRQSVPEE